ncbi:alpha/beta hydrolase [uncultured Ruegeria sp.]|uniref:alpha/beta fold hydrolase n=1 Tax=uncultured Ruegeria sp. TaxID=259304 RepID=UPI002617BA94|nr:alpha/beta hydrolase [uncultured Ruegeria sp.]
MITAKELGTIVVIATAFAVCWITSTSAQDTEMKLQMIDGPQGRLAAYHRPGNQEGVAVVFLHGDSSRALQWAPVWRELNTPYGLIALDFRGHGESEPARDGDYSYAGRGEDVIAVVDALGAKEFLLVAHSGAAGAAFEIGVRKPAKVAGIFLLDPPNDPRSLADDVRQGFVEALAGPNSLDVQHQYFSSIAGKDPIVAARVLEDAVIVDPAARLGIGKAIADWNPEIAIEGYNGPLVMMISGVMDQSSSLSRLWPGISTEIVANTGHWIQLERPDVVVGALLEFIQGVEQARGQ